jgi:hypothetical protein
MSVLEREGYHSHSFPGGCEVHNWWSVGAKLQADSRQNSTFSYYFDIMEFRNVSVSPN